MADKMISVRFAIRNSSLAEKFEQIVNTINGLQMVTTRNDLKNQILIYELGQDTQKDFQTIQSHLEAQKFEDIFLTSKNTEPELLMEAMRVGVKEFFKQPIDDKEVREAFERFKNRRPLKSHKEPEKNGKILCVSGTKGGVGVTTIAVNLGIILAQSEKPNKVVLFDMNHLFGDIALLLEISPKFSWGDITGNVNRIDTTFLMNVLSKHSSGLHVLSSPSHLNGHRPLTPEIITYLLNLMKNMFDYVIIDAGQSTSNEHLKAFEMSDEVLLVSTLTIPCLSNTSKLLQSLIKLGYIKKDQIKFVINRNVKKSEISIRDAEESINHKAFWIIPNDYKSAITAVNKGLPLTLSVPKSPVSKSLRGIAEKLLPGSEDITKKRWLFF